MYENWAIVPLLTIILLSCPITNQVGNQSNTTSNVTNITVTNTTNMTNNILPNTIKNQTNVESASKTQETVCLEGLRQMVARVGYPRGSVFYCDCTGSKNQFQCSAVFIDKEVSANINCDQNEICTVKSNIMSQLG